MNHDMYKFCIERGMPEAMRENEQFKWLREHIKKQERMMRQCEALLSQFIKTKQRADAQVSTLRNITGSIADEMEQLPLDILTDVGFANMFEQCTKLVKYHESIGVG